MHLITYGAPNFSLDAAIVDVLNPNDWKYYSKFNPTCQNPRIIIRNTGSTTLTSAEINVWVGEFDNVVTYHWTGNLEFLEEEMIEIPVEPEWWYDYQGMTTFSARIYKANGQFDEYSNNDVYTVSFEPTATISDPFYIWFKTNNKSIENDLMLKDQDGNIIFSRTTLTNTTEYKDTMYLDPGCYTLEITDTDHDGISFWYSAIPVSDGGEGETSGFLRLRKVGGSTIYTFDPDFGHYSKFSFTVGYSLSVDDATSVAPAFTVYPNPNQGDFSLVLDHFTGDQIEITVYNELGALVYLETISENNPEGYLEKNISLTDVPPGMYLVRVVSDNAIHTERIIIN
ncbi:MAG: T9SS type A sorting domain-containing protein [Crocinitomicaceae bacterium]|nr:T9SS type A sorting domain-containing protein [Crocinitomicaceae bacterium]